MKTNTRILIVEDEVLIAEHLAKILRSQGYEQVQMVHRLSKALETLQSQKFDLALLDINLNSQTEGVEIAKAIEKDYKFPYMFITAQTDPLVLGMAVKLHPKAFITKPFNKVDVAMAVELALGGEEEKEDYLVFKDGWTTIKLPHSHVYWAEADGNYIHLHCKDKNYTVRYSLSWLESVLDETTFIKVHRSRLINLRLVESLEADTVCLKGQRIGISKSGYQRLKKLIGE